MNYNIIKYHRQIQIASRVPGIQTYTGPGDVITTQAVSWWGLRAYSDATVGRNSVKLRRSSDNATQSFQTLDNGSIDIASITAFKGAANLFVDTLYDQIGNTHLFQATAANQPQFILNGLGTNPVMRFVSATPLWMLSTGQIIINQPFTWSLVANRTAVHLSTAMGNNTQTIGWTSVANTAFLHESGGVDVTNNAATDNIFHAIQYIFNGANCDVSVDGLDSFGNPGVTTNMVNAISLGADPVGTNPCDMDYLESGIWNIAFSTQQENALSVNQHSDWGF